MPLFSTLFYLISILSTIHLTLAAYNPADAVNYFTATIISTGDVENILGWTCVRCSQLTGYRPFHSEKLQSSANEDFPVTMLHNSDSKKFVTAFPGTATLKQLLLESINLASIDYELHNIPDAKAVRYFYNRYSKVLRDAVLKKVAEAYKAYPDYQFVFTGHSLGAAITTLAAFDVVASGIVPSSQVAVYNFGSPRVGNQALAQAIEKAIPEFYRIVHWRDPVPHIPLCVKNFAGKCVTKSTLLHNVLGTWPTWHVAKEVFYNKDHSGHKICDGGEDIECADQFKMKDTTWADHFDYMNISLPIPGALIASLDTLTKLRYPSLF